MNVPVKAKINAILDVLNEINCDACGEGHRNTIALHQPPCIHGVCKMAGTSEYMGCYKCRLVIAREALLSALNEGAFDE
jgi:hypothetical protein